MFFEVQNILEFDACAKCGKCRSYRSFYLRFCVDGQTDTFAVPKIELDEQNTDQTGSFDVQST